MIIRLKENKEKYTLVILDTSYRVPRLVINIYRGTKENPEFPISQSANIPFNWSTMSLSNK